MTPTAHTGTDLARPGASDVVRLDRRRVRLAAQAVLWRRSQIPAVRKCGRIVSDAAKGVQLRVTTGPEGRRAGLAGLQTCGSVWACTVCSARILGKRQQEVATAARAWTARGGQVALATFTVRHTGQDSCASVWDAVSAGWDSITTDRAWRAARAAYGVASAGGYCTAKSCQFRPDAVEADRYYGCDVACCGLLDTVKGRRHQVVCRKGQEKDSVRRHREAGTCDEGVVVDAVLPWLRVVEVTHGANGYHVHAHAVLFLPAGMDAGALDRLYAAMWQRWDRGVRATGMDGGLMVNRAEFVVGDVEQKVSAYLTKGTYEPRDAATKVAAEATRGDLKVSRFDHSTRPMMEVLRAVVLGDAKDPVRDVAVWGEYEVASRGRRQMTWAHGARALLALDEVEQSDEELAAVEEGSADDAIADVSTVAWAGIRSVPGRRVVLLEAAERSTVEALQLLDAWHVEWSPPSAARPDRALPAA